MGGLSSSTTLRGTAVFVVGSGQSLLVKSVHYHPTTGNSAPVSLVFSA